ncbi:MAG TPA: pyridoxamine 5'-phosphate oxidase family protein [Gordonia sp. (in: high G+C Gram-positive bacteria)]|uniref:pyridoxamine 5'-phosphate oxidase family protein n=1 Tax=Gordonia sp. (in: high G+C Gram-positive bacteria) TaxID=84139 RepID=UPI000FA293D6|nr:MULTISPECIES: pyridoxamine 5'-phosphate oxidase family protein [unclassified Gordonia (in: high G+C Gram-positive bacteria)]RUP37090.1 MAG: pyridoxamine 5'-phosphate oxidase family protein [Gordonia sp. (in: high G+C Gram-positive bacteria)]HNP55454.1 pyridoxamine 5'-phosphate oxidase family protein [Gordonia sp. (in: high G+C Gram-positive bacteria)]HRC50129.1 pyridoxamine 5'-phosphate oxidase family protein [Gordonia sp. (in: high G+C Gram-positive bacteria)]
MVEGNPIEVLDEAQAWGLLATREFGRLATSVGNQPEIFPINFHAGDGKIYFRTAAGTKLSEIAVNDRLAFEADETGTDGGWSVIAKGRAHILTGTREIAAADELPLRSWVPTLKYDYVELAVDEISARRFTFGPEPDRYGNQ